MVQKICHLNFNIPFAFAIIFGDYANNIASIRGPNLGHYFWGFKLAIPKKWIRVCKFAFGIICININSTNLFNFKVSAFNMIIILLAVLLIWEDNLSREAYNYLSLFTSLIIFIKMIYQMEFIKEANLNRICIVGFYLLIQLFLKFFKIIFRAFKKIFQKN